MDDDCPPSYDDVMNQMRTAEHTPTQETPDKAQKRYWLFLRYVFTASDTFLSFAAIVGYAFILITDPFCQRMVDVAALCDNEIYKRQLKKQVSTTFAYMAMFFVYFSITLTSFFGFSWKMAHLRKLIVKILRKAWNVSIVFLALCCEVQVLQQCYGIPRPYYFTNEKIYAYFCNKGQFTKNLLAQDLALRKSFPSMLVATECYATTFIICYLDHFDIGFGPHATQLAVCIFFGTKCVLNGSSLYMNNENHLSDIIVGAILGVIAAAYTVRNLKGTVLRNIESWPKYITNKMLFDILRRNDRHTSSNGRTYQAGTAGSNMNSYDFPIELNHVEPTAPPIQD